MSEFPSFLRLNNVVCLSHILSVRPQTDTWVAPTCWLMSTTQLWGHGSFDVAHFLEVSVTWPKKKKKTFTLGEIWRSRASGSWGYSELTLESWAGEGANRSPWQICSLEGKAGNWTPLLCLVMLPLGQSPAARLGSQDGRTQAKEEPGDESWQHLPPPPGKCLSLSK